MARKRPNILAIVITFITLAMIPVMGIAFSRWQWNRKYQQRPRHLASLGLAVITYAKQHNGSFPDSLEQLVFAGSISPDFLVCPAGDEVPATGSGAELQKQLSQPGHNSYVYLGRGKTLSTMSHDDILIYERAPDSGDGANVCAADAHTEWIPMPTLREALAKPHDQLR